MDITGNETQAWADERIMIVSDLHLGAGADPESAPFESFCHDGAFARFIDDAVQRAGVDGRSLRLIILGDLVDFPRTRLRHPREGSGDDLACAKLRRIIASHPAVFEALARLLRDGHRIDLLPGNHDLELVRPSVAQVLCGALGGSAANVRVNAWLLHIPGVLYAEHGNQYHDINSFPALADAPRVPIRAWERPIGARLDDTLLDFAGRIDPTAMTSPSPLRAMIRAGGKRPLSVFACGPRVARFAWQVIAEVGFPKGGRRQRRATYRAQALPPMAAETGLPPDALAAIDGLAEEIAAGLPRRLRRLVAGRLRRRGPSVSPASAVRGEQAAYLPEIASRIDRILQRSQHQVPVLVFGHTHHADDLPLPGSSLGTRYLNAGSWLIRDDHQRPLTTFVELDLVGGQTARAELRRWHDAEGCSEVFKLG